MENKSPRLFKTALAVLLGLNFCLLSVAQDEASESLNTDPEAIKTFGWMVAQQSVVQMEFTEAELSIFLEGFNEGALDTDSNPASKQAELQAMGAYLSQRAAQIQERLAKEQEVISKAYFANLLEDASITKSDSGLCYKILEPGDETRATPQDQVLVHYRGTLTDGTVFDSSYDRGQPAQFGVSQVVPGFSEGVQLIGKGGKAKLYIPSELGYGPQVPPGGAIPPNAVLVFDIEMVDILKADAAE